MVTNIPPVTTSTSTPPETSTKTIPITTVPSTASPTTTTIATSTTTTTTTLAPTTVPEATTVAQTTAAVLDTTAVIDLSTKNVTTSTVAPQAGDVTIIAAIAGSAVVCILLIIGVCYLMFRRGDRKKSERNSLAMNDSFASNHKQNKKFKSELGDRLSTIAETGQSHDGRSRNSQSDSSRDYVNAKHMSLTKELNGKEQVANAEEPQYENFTASNADLEADYIDPNMPETSPKDADKLTKTSDENGVESFYENFTSSQDYANTVKDDKSQVYQNSQPQGPEESFYEDPIQNNKDEIYMDMA